MRNCHRNSNANHHGFKKEKKKDSSGPCLDALLFNFIDFLGRLHLPCLLNDIVHYRGVG